jgi:hypothetical protein
MKKANRFLAEMLEIKNHLTKLKMKINNGSSLKVVGKY